MTPLYDELVVKYYLSKGIAPFSFPARAVEVREVAKIAKATGEPVTFARQGHVTTPYFELHTDDPQPKTQSNGYFNL